MFVLNMTHAATSCDPFPSRTFCTSGLSFPSRNTTYIWTSFHLLVFVESTSTLTNDHCKRSEVRLPVTGHSSEEVTGGMRRLKRDNSRLVGRQFINVPQDKSVANLTNG